MTAGRRSPAPALAGLAAVVTMLLPQLFDSSFALTLLSQMAIFVVFALSYNLLFGLAGMLSFGHAVYSGLGAYATVHLLNALASGSGPWQSPLTVALLPLAGGLIGALAGVLLGYPSTRRGGTSLAMITLGIGEMVHAAALTFPDVFGGEGGIPTDRVLGRPLAGISFGPAIEVYYLTAAWCLAATAAMYAFSRTPLGEIAQAVRDNAERVEFIGYSARRVRYLVLIVSSFFAGLSGGLAAINFEFATAENLSSLQSGAVLFATFIGGAAWFGGPILGAVVYVLFAMALSDYTPAWLLYLGLFFVLMVMYAPGGLASLLVRLHEIIRAGRLPALLASGAGTAVAAGLLTLVLIFGIELTYHRALDVVGEPRVRVLGLVLDTRSAATWLALLVALAVTVPLFECQRRGFLRRWPPHDPSDARSSSRLSGSGPRGSGP